MAKKKDERNLFRKQTKRDKLTRAKQEKMLEARKEPNKDEEKGVVAGESRNIFGKAARKAKFILGRQQTQQIAESVKEEQASEVQKYNRRHRDRVQEMLENKDKPVPADDAISNLKPVPGRRNESPAVVKRTNLADKFAFLMALPEDEGVVGKANQEVGLKKDANKGALSPEAAIENKPQGGLGLNIFKKNKANGKKGGKK